MGNLADDCGTDVEIYRSTDGQIRADSRTGAPGLIDRTLRQFGFTAPLDPGNPASYSLQPKRPGADQLLAASGAAGLLDDCLYQVAIEHQLVVGYIGSDTIVRSDGQRLAAARKTSPAAAQTNATAQPPTAAPVPAAKVPQQRKR
ncbi:hypothetical protein ACIGXM_25325 [Kitasatospora sp. NPDC052896]|uniref:hypothetical protein n=1 Tax=Kitasatospora sp. NPDC052896 TaxID=3364061 RepID=UPI0037C927EC